MKACSNLKQEWGFHTKRLRKKSIICWAGYEEISDYLVSVTIETAPFADSGFFFHPLTSRHRVNIQEQYSNLNKFY
jgi:hypothetical protein